tara:strand:- start:5312 stop:5473 length:162 start_codon:yes stop_codon:yes gene_type:complete
MKVYNMKGRTNASSYNEVSQISLRRAAPSFFAMILIIVFVIGMAPMAIPPHFM